MAEVWVLIAATVAIGVAALVGLIRLWRAKDPEPGSDPTEQRN